MFVILSVVLVYVVRSLIDRHCSFRPIFLILHFTCSINSMECLAGAWNIVPCLWGCSDKHAKYITDLESNLASLRSERLKLKDIREDASNRVREAEEQQMKRRNQVNGWLERVEAVESEVDEILQKGEQELGYKCLGSCCPKNCRSSYKIGKNVLKMIPRVTKLTEEGQFDVVADELPPPPVDELLMDSLVSLRSAMVKLKNLREDVMNRVTEAEEQPMKRTNQVTGWVTSVEAVEKGHEELESRCVGSSSPRTRYKLRDEVMKMVLQVTTLTEEGQFDVVTHQLPPPTVNEQPMDNVVVGFESKFEEVWHSVQNNDCPVIGLVGMGGVGKTTLLKQLNNEFLKATHEYDLVIWIVVSKPANLGKIRGTLRSKLNISYQMWENISEDEKNSLIFSKLKKKKFVVLLDDMWEGLNLSVVGIPRPSMDSPGSKIVLTTRSQEVCQSMGADKVIPVGCLPPDQAFNLFYSKLGEDILKSRPEMRGLITEVASECEGLPLALITIGNAMTGKKHARQWKEAKRTLERYPSTFMGKEDGVFSKLLFSYDSLPNPMVKKCFEYCSLYPEDHNIIEEEVIKLWLGEGLIGEYDNMYDALIQGRQTIETLKQACLLETGERLNRHSRTTELFNGYSRMEETVKMHDVIRDMALWIACEQEEKRKKFCVEVASHHDDITFAPNAMTNAEKISLRGEGITTECLAGMPFCPSLATLVIQSTRLEELPGELFHAMNVLKVLNLSDNHGLRRVPMEKGCLTNLEYLNIVGTDVRLSAGASQWKKLRFLIVGDTLIIPKKIISSLCSLQMFEQICTLKDNTLLVHERKSIDTEILPGLEGLKHIMDIRVTLYSATGTEKWLNSPKLQKCTTRLAVQGVDLLPDILDFGTETLAKHLERLQIDYCHMSEVKLGRPSLGSNLCNVYFSSCNEIRNLNSLIYVPNLCILQLIKCESMSELIGEEETCISTVGTSLFSSLTFLNLFGMRKLRSICPQSALPFPSLELVEIQDCPSLRKLPLDTNTVSTIPQQFIIKGETKWWDRLEWDSQATKDGFTPKFMEWSWEY